MAEGLQKTKAGRVAGTVGLVLGVVIAYAMGWGLLGAILCGIAGLVVVGSLGEVLAGEAAKKGGGGPPPGTTGGGSG